MNACAYRYGWWAAAVGTPESWNPFKNGTAAADSWIEGHRDSQAAEISVKPRLEPIVEAAIASRGVGA